MKKKLIIALVIVVSALTITFSPTAASAEECPDAYVQPAVCNTENPPGPFVPERLPLPETGSDFDWTAWIVGGILLLGAGIVALNIAAKNWDRGDRLEEEEEE